MKSMTGFGSGSALNKEFGISFTVELVAVNRKQLEIRPALPREIGSFEPLLRKQISTMVHRGSIAARVNMELQSNSNLAAKSTKINDALVGALYKRCRRIQSKYEIPGDVSLSDILTMPGVVEAAAPDFNIPEIEQTFVGALKQALDNLIVMKQREGNHLREDLMKRINYLQKTLEKIIPLSKGIPDIQKKRLMERLKNAGLEIDINDERVLKEMVVFTDKSDVSEELTRLNSHFSQFLTILNKENEAIGRSLEFMIQEMFREITTLGNKALHSDISQLVVIFKTEIEKIREQVQNIE